MLEVCRKLVYSHPSVHRLAVRVRSSRPHPNRMADHWDRELSGPKQFYLSGSLLIRCHNAIVARMIQEGQSGPLEILDLGCGPGELLSALPAEAVGSYTGIDISRVAVQYSRDRFATDPERMSRSRFVQSDLCAFHPEANAAFDAIVFNEVLYYLDVEEAVRQVLRSHAWLKPGGRLCVSMKEDPKSRLIYRLLLRDFQVIASIWGQYSISPTLPRRIRKDRENFPFLTALLERVPRSATRPKAP